MVDAPRILAGRYEVDDLIGRGGMAEVHIGHDTRLGRTVAIKMLRPDLARDPAFQARFRREAQAAAALNHPAIVAVYDTGEEMHITATGVEERTPFIVMEYVEGHTVRDILQGGQAVPIDEAAEITIGVLSALEYSHHAGIVHRDIKPANIMITPTGAVKVMDFGIARAVADTSQTMTQTQAVIGTAQYLSPEQARGETVDTRSDLYSTGCVLFELLTGRPPFVGDSPVSVAYQHVREEVPIPSSIASDVPEPLDRICVKALAKERNLRYQTASEFRADLEAFLSGQPVSAPPIGALAAGALAGAALGAAATQAMAAPAGATEVMSRQTQAWPAVGDQNGQLEDDEEEEEPGKRRWIMWTLIGVAAALVIGLVAYFVFFAGAGDDSEVDVPDVVGMEEVTAKEEIEKVGLVFERREAYSNEVEVGKVIETDPAAGETVAKDTQVNVVISKGAEDGLVPDLTGLTVAEAEQQLTDNGLVLGQQEESDSKDVAEGRIVETVPAAGQPIKGGEAVNLKVSNGMVTIGNFQGKDSDEVQAELEGLGLSVDMRGVETSDADPNTVISQSPAAGKVRQGSQVQITFAKVPSTSTVPNVIGTSQESASSTLTAKGFQVDVQYGTDSTYPAGQVFKTTPGAGAQVTYGYRVTIWISTGASSSPGPTS